MSNFIRSLFLFSFLVLFLSGVASAFEENFNDNTFNAWDSHSAKSQIYSADSHSIDGTSYFSNDATGSSWLIKTGLGNITYWEISGRSFDPVDPVYYYFKTSDTNNACLLEITGTFISTYGQSGSCAALTAINYPVVPGFKYKVSIADLGTTLLINIFNLTNGSLLQNYVIADPLDDTGSIRIEAHTGGGNAYIAIDNIIASAINPNLDSYINFAHPSYAVNDIVPIDYAISDADYHWYSHYSINLVNVATGNVAHTFEGIPQTGTYYFQPQNAASIRADLIETFFTSTVIASSNAVIGEYTSYIFSSSPVSAGFLHNVSYLWGFTPTQDSFKYINLKWFNPDKNAWEIDYVTPVFGNVVNVMYTTQVIFPHAGKYLLELVDLNKQGTAASISVYTFISGGFPEHNFTTSNITILHPLSSYSAGDWLEYSYYVDGYNYSHVQTSIELYNYQAASYLGLEWIQKDLGNGKTYLLNNMITGPSALCIVGKNSTGIRHNIACTNLTISSLDSEGYSLTADKVDICKNINVLVTGICPAACVITFTDKKIVSYNITGTRSYSIKPVSDMSITIDDATGQQKKRLAIMVNESCNVGGVPGTSPTPSTGPEATNKFISSGMLVVLIVMMIFAGAGQLIGGFSGAVMGFGSGFIFLSVFGYVPVWALFLFAIIAITAFAVMGGKSIVGGGKD